MSSKLFIRNVKESDIKSVYRLSNESYVRKFSISKNNITWSEHVEWFHHNVKSDEVVFHVITDINDEFLGQIRYKLKARKATISLSLNQLIKGKGYSKFLLKESLTKLFSESDFIDSVEAYVSKDNIASNKLFKNAGFRKCKSNSELELYKLEKGKI